MQNFEVGQRVQYLSGGKNWKPFGIVEELQSPVSMNGATLISPMCKVRWEESGELSGWLFFHELADIIQRSPHGKW